MNRKARRSNPRGVHKLVSETAKELAGAAYEECAGKVEGFYKLWPNQRVYIAKQWAAFIPTAREILVDMLTDPMTSDFEKDNIVEGLMLDGSINPPVVHAEQEAAKQSLIKNTHLQ